MQVQDRKEPQPSLHLLRVFSLSWGMFLAAGAVWAWSEGLPRPVWGGLTSIAIVFGSGLFFPNAMRPLLAGVERLFAPLGSLMSTLLMAGAFYTAFTFVALLLRVFGHDALRLGRGTRQQSGWHPHRDRTESLGYHGQY